MIEIPLTNSPEQRFSITLEGQVYQVRVVYNSRYKVWTMSLYIGEDPVIEGVALVAGINILDQYNLPLDQLWVVNLEDPSRDPTQAGLGTNSKLFDLTDAEVQSVSSI